jgi:hypothetical protein
MFSDVSRLVVLPGEPFGSVGAACEWALVRWTLLYLCVTTRLMSNQVLFQTERFLVSTARNSTHKSFLVESPAVSTVVFS